MSRVSALAFIEPQLPTLAEHPPQGDGWLHEVKHDGYRTMLALLGGTAFAYSRNGFDWTDRYPGIVRAAAQLRCKSAMLDGEVIVQNADGVSDFEKLQTAVKARSGALIFYGFDLLHLDGTDLRNRPLSERRRLLQKLLDGNPDSPLQYSEEYVGDADALFRACAERRLEGIVSKLANSLYQSGRSTTWLKTKCFTESVLTLVGIDRDRKTKAPLALLAKTDEHGLDYAGAAFIALPGAAREMLAAKLDEFAADVPAISYLRNKQARWVKPLLVVKVKHLAGSRYLRHATVRELFLP
jgi:DNA ligase D-like protein (predicted ligase)